MGNNRLFMRVALACVILMVHTTLIAGCGSDDDEEVSDDSSGNTTAPPSSGGSSSNQPATNGQGTASGPYQSLDELLAGMTLVGDQAARDQAQKECMSQGRQLHWMQDSHGQWWVECCPVGQAPVFNLPDRGPCKPKA